MNQVPKTILILSFLLLPFLGWSTSVNPAIQLAKVRSRIDAQQEIINKLESELQKAILGSTPQTYGSLINVGYSGFIYNKLLNHLGSGEIELVNTISESFYVSIETLGCSPEQVAEQDVLRQLLYQSRAMLGELRIEEQMYAIEVTAAKSGRKTLSGFSKG